MFIYSRFLYAFELAKLYPIRHRSISSLLDDHEEWNKTYYQYVCILLVYIIS